MTLTARSRRSSDPESSLTARSRRSSDPGRAASSDLESRLTASSDLVCRCRRLRAAAAAAAAAAWPTVEGGATLPSECRPLMKLPHGSIVRWRSRRRSEVPGLAWLLRRAGPAPVPLPVLVPVPLGWAVPITRLVSSGSKRK